MSQRKFVNSLSVTYDLSRLASAVLRMKKNRWWIYNNSDLSYLFMRADYLAASANHLPESMSQFCQCLFVCVMHTHRSALPCVYRFYLPTIYCIGRNTCFLFVSFVVSTDYVAELVYFLAPADRLHAFVFEISPSLYSLVIFKVFSSHTIALNRSLCLDWWCNRR